MLANLGVSIDKSFFAALEYVLRNEVAKANSNGHLLTYLISDILWYIEIIVRPVFFTRLQIVYIRP